MQDILAIEMKPSQNSNPIQDLLNNLFINRKPPINTSPEYKETQELLNNLNQAKKELDIANSNFEFAKDDELLDYFIYEIKAAETRYQYLLKKVKERNLNFEDSNNLHIKSRKDKCV